MCNKRLAFLDSLSHLYRIQPSWVHIKRKNTWLFWQGGETTIYEDSRQIVWPIVSVPKWLKWCAIEKEVLAHELVHAARCSFDEQKYEEILAYKTTKRHWKSYLGPMFYSTKISVMTLLLGAFVLFFPWLSVGFMLWLGFLFYRVFRLQRKFALALKKIAFFFSPSINPLFVAIHLTDLEIDTFATADVREIDALILHWKNSLRWQQILARYPLKSL